MYAYFESILKPANEDVDVTQGVDTGIESSSKTFQEHIPCSFAYKIVSSVDPDFSRPIVMYRGEDAAEMFVRKIEDDKVRDHFHITGNYRGAAHNACNLLYRISKPVGSCL